MGHVLLRGIGERFEPFTHRGLGRLLCLEDKVQQIAEGRGRSFGFLS